MLFTPPKCHSGTRDSWDQAMLFKLCVVQFWWPQVCFSVLSWPLIWSDLSWLCVNPVLHQQPCQVQSHLHHVSSPFWCLAWTSAGRLDCVYMSKCTDRCRTIGWLEHILFSYQYLTSVVLELLLNLQSLFNLNSKLYSCWTEAKKVF